MAFGSCRSVSRSISCDGGTMDDRRIARRSFLQGAGLAALTAAGIVPCESQVQIAVPNSGGTEPPKLKAPAFASDCHHHIYDTARFPAVPRPEPNASVVEYRLYKRRIGTTRDVIVTPGAYGITVSHSTLFLNSESMPEVLPSFTPRSRIPS